MVASFPVLANIANNSKGFKSQGLFATGSPYSCIKKMAKGLKSLMSVGADKKTPLPLTGNGV
jgi:hypothetical protein